MDVRGKVALVTGGSDGIGREIALQLQGAGADVTVTGRSAAKLQAMASLGFGTIAGDLSTPAGVDAVVNGVADKGMPHLLCTYLYELSGNFMTFYEACPINKDGVDEATRQSRLLLCAATAKVLKLGLGVLGIHTLERM